MRVGLIATYVALASWVALLGCATPPSGPRPVGDPNQRLQGASFSVLPPGGEEWFVVIDASSSTIAFAKKDPEHIKQRGSVIILATRVRASNDDITTAEGLLSEIDKSVRTQSARYTLVSVKLEPHRDTAMSTDCVLINTVSEERNNPNRPGETLLMTVSGKACRHPLSPAFYVRVAMSERRPVGSPPLVDDKLRKECERAIDSMEFLSPR